MKWITEEDIASKIKTKHQAIEKSIHHWLQLSIASLDDFKEIIQEHGKIPMDGGECGLCEYAGEGEGGGCCGCPLKAIIDENFEDACCVEYTNMLQHRYQLQDNLNYKNKRKFQNAAKKLLIRLLKIKYKEE